MNATIRGAVVAVAALNLMVLLPGSLHAQQQERRGQAGVGTMAVGCPMPGCAHATLGPDTALEHREELGLSPQQVATLETLAADLREQRSRLSTKMSAARDQVNAAAQGPRFDQATVRGALDRVADLHADAAFAALSAQHVTRQVLSSAQEAKLRKLAPRGTQAGVGSCPMMQPAPGPAPMPR